MKSIFITGIAGFIGFHLALALKKRGDCVVGCDNFNSYYDPSLKRKRAKFLHQAGISVGDIDITESVLMHKALQDNMISHCVHLAAQAGVRHALVHPEHYVHSNLNGFAAILEVLRHHKGIPLIYASSSSVYGLNSKIPFSEMDTTDQPASFYGATKKSNELMAHAYHHLYDIPCTALRFFTVYGPWGRPDMAYYSFAQAISEGRPLAVFGDGQMRRDFTYIDDIVKGAISAIDLSASFEIFNLGNNKPHSIIEMISILETLLKKKAIIAFQTPPRGEVPLTYADISKSQQMLGFQPIVSLGEGLKQFIDWFQQSSFLDKYEKRTDKSPTPQAMT